MIFVQKNIEDTIQENDLTRLEFLVVKTPDEGLTDLVEVEPETGAGFFDITSFTERGKNYLDYAYATEGIKNITLRVTVGGVPMDYAFDTNIITAETDRLFSDDQDIVSCEDDILNYIRKGRASFLDKHREAQSRIMSHLDRKRIYLRENVRLNPENIADLEEVRNWSKYLTLQIIFEGLINETQDVFQEKADRYRELATNEAARAALTIQQDLDGDGNIDDEEKSKIDLMSYRMVRR